jgi:hypothetical protein
MHGPKWEEFRESFERIDREQEEAKQRRHEEWEKEYVKNGGVLPEKQEPKFHGNCDSPYTMENGTATFFWLVVMAVGSIFKGNWVIWIIATIVWWKFITRHKGG